VRKVGKLEGQESRRIKRDRMRINPMAKTYISRTLKLWGI
jgi:hypothetical protein